MAGHRSITSDTQRLLQMALRQPQVGPVMACNAVALWVYLDHLYPQCHFQSRILSISSTADLFTEFIIEADTAVTRLGAQDPILQVDQLLVNTSNVIINPHLDEDFSFMSCFQNEDVTRARFLDYVRACRTACGNLQDNDHVDARTLQVHYNWAEPVTGANVIAHINRAYGLHIDTTAFTSSRQALIYTVLLQTPQDVTKILPFINSTNIRIQGPFINSTSIRTQGGWVSIYRIEKINCDGLELEYDRTLRVDFMRRRVPVPEADTTAITDHICSKFKLNTATIVIEEDHPLTGTMVLQTPQDVEKVLPSINFKLFSIDGQRVYITRKKKIEMPKKSSNLVLNQGFTTITANTQRLFQSAVQRNKLSPLIAWNAVGFYEYLDTEYPQCKILCFMVSHCDKFDFADLIREAAIAVTHLLNQDSELKAHQVDQELLKHTNAELVRVNKCSPNLKRLFEKKEDSSKRLVLFVMSCMYAYEHLVLMRHQLVHQEQESSTHDVIGKTPDIKFLIQRPVDQLVHQKQGSPDFERKWGCSNSTLEELKFLMGKPLHEGDVDWRTLEIECMIEDPEQTTENPEETTEDPKETTDITDILTRKYGDCIESIITNTPTTGTMVLRSPTDVARVMGGPFENTKKFAIQGNNVRMSRKMEMNDPLQNVEPHNRELHNQVPNAEPISDLHQPHNALVQLPNQPQDGQIQVPNHQIRWTRLPKGGKKNKVRKERSTENVDVDSRSLKIIFLQDTVSDADIEEHITSEFGSCFEKIDIKDVSTRKSHTMVLRTAQDVKNVMAKSAYKNDKEVEIAGKRVVFRSMKKE